MNNNVLSVSGARVIAQFSYNPSIKDEFKSAGARWEPDQRYWYAPVSKLQTMLQIAREWEFTIDASVTAALDSQKEVARQVRVQTEIDANARQIAEAVSAAPLAIVGLKSALMPHQSTPVRMIAQTSRLLLADAPGLGKSITSIAALLHVNAARTVIICPASLTSNWVNEFEQHAPGARVVHVLEGNTGGTIAPDAQVVICNWSIVSARKNELVAWNADFLVVDEAHYAKSGTKSSRAEAALALSLSIRKNSGRVLLLTGTPIVNRPLELAPLVSMLGAHHQLFGGEREFLNRYCGPRYQNIGRGRTTLIYDGATNTGELHEKLVKSGLYLRRTKLDLVRAGQLGDKLVNGISALNIDDARVPGQLQLSEEGRAEYDRAVIDFVQFIEQLVISRAEEEGVRATPSFIDQCVRRATSTILPQIGYVRGVLGRVKIPAVIARARELVDQGEQVVIVAHHREVVDALVEALGAVRIQGGMKPREVEAAKAAFNARQVMVLVMAIEAGKTGHTLCLQKINGAGQEARHMLIAEEPWSPGDEEQAQDRLWRIGQTRDVVIEVMTAHNTMDRGIFDLREQKRRVVNAVVDGSDLDEDKIQSASFLTNYLIRERNDQLERIDPELAV